MPLPTIVLIVPAAMPATKIAIASSGSTGRARLLCGRGRRLGVIAGSALHDAELPEGRWQVVRRHQVAAGYELPHRIDHVATMRALADSGCDRVLALSSVGGLRAELVPGTLLVPDDFIALDAEPLSALEGPEAHRVPGFDPGWRAALVAALDDAGIEAIGEGVYWQTRGPRLETPGRDPADRRARRRDRDDGGSECVIAGELGLRYAALCVVDNLANGVGERELTLDEIERQPRRERGVTAGHSRGRPATPGITRSPALRRSLSERDSPSRCRRTSVRGAWPRVGVRRRRREGRRDQAPGLGRVDHVVELEQGRGVERLRVLVGVRRPSPRGARARSVSSAIASSSRRKPSLTAPSSPIAPSSAVGQPTVSSGSCMLPAAIAWAPSP